MSTGSHSFPGAPRGADVLGELLHSLSQPLTTLRCSLELSMEEAAEQRQASVSAALQQTEKVIGMIQLMREYLDAEQPRAETFSSGLAPAMHSVANELASIAEVRGVRLRAVGTCAATLALPESQLRLALQYLIAALIDVQPAGGKVTLLLGEGPAGAVLRVEGDRRSRDDRAATSGSAATLRRTKLAIASRVLEGAGASLVVFGNVDPMGFVLRVPAQQIAAMKACAAQNR